MVKKSRFGPGFLVAAAFIGPGTVTAASLAGAWNRFDLIWVVAFAILAAIVLQEMVGRFSLATRLDVASALSRFTPKGNLRLGFQILAFLAIIVGCAAYESGNIIGGSLGMEFLTHIKLIYWVLVISSIAAIMLIRRKYHLIEKVLIGLVVVMGISSLVTAIILKPDLSAILKGFIPRIPATKGTLWRILALLGTTVVPYNLFLHSSVILKKWKEKSDIRLMRSDTFLSIGLGGLITISIIITATMAFASKGALNQNTIEMSQRTIDLSNQLVPLFGDLARIFFGIGLFAAGLSSAITAPYAAAWTAAGLFGWKEKDKRFTLVALAVLGFGALTGFMKLKPLYIIMVAQVTNALILPVVAIFVLYLLNRREAGEFKNRLWQNALFLVVLLVIILINLKHLT